MSALAMRHFNSIDYLRQLRDAGVSQVQAEVQAQTLEQIVNDIDNNFVTDIQLNEFIKKDALVSLEIAINNLEYSTQKRIDDLDIKTQQSIAETQQMITDLDIKTQKSIDDLANDIKLRDVSIKKDFAEFKFDVIKWMLTTVLGTGFGIVIAIAGLLKTMLH
jgi:hypothetical protein